MTEINQVCTDMIKIGGIVNKYAPVADRHTGERRKVDNQGDLGNLKFLEIFEDYLTQICSLLRAPASYFLDSI